MVTSTVLCRHCGSDDVIGHGHDPKGSQRLLCHSCERSFREQPGSRAYDPTFRARVLAAYHERASMRGVCRIFGISRNTLSDWLKKTTSAKWA